MTFNVETAFVLISLLASLSVYFQINKGYRYLRFFPPFLLITFCLETFISFLANKTGSNFAAYSLFGTLEFFFYLWVIRQAIESRKARMVLSQVLWLFPLFAVIDLIFIQGLDNFNSYSYSIGSLLIVLFCIWYFYDLFQSEHSRRILSDPSFWICCGLFFYYCCSFPLFGLINFLRNMPRFNNKTLHIILYLMNIVLYSSFTIAFLCRLKVRNSTS
jgi:hypothetical protein